MKTTPFLSGAARAAAVILLLAASAGQAGTLHFNGSTAYVWMGARPELKVTGTNITLEAWIKPTGRGSDATAGGIIMGREGEYLLARFADGTIRYALAATSPVWGWNNTGIVVPSNQWSHVALTYDGTVVTFYVNGTLRSLIGGSGVIADADASRNDFMVGARQAVAQYFQGQIDEVRVWNVTRSAAEIQAYIPRPLQGSEPGLLGYFRCEEGFGLATADVTGRGSTGMLLGSPPPLWDNASEALLTPVPLVQPASLVSGTTARLNAVISPNGAATNAFWLATNISTALTLDGINDAVSFSSTPTYLYNAYPLTVTAWVKTARAGGGGGLINKYLSGSRNGWLLYLVNGQIRAWYFRDAANYVWDGGLGLNGGNVDDGQWHHVAFSVGTTGGRLYVDGILTATNAWTGSPGACTTTQPLRFGLYDTYFAGQLDDVTVWKTELTAGAIAQLMSDSPTPAHPQYASLVSYWPLDAETDVAASEAWGRNPAGMFVGSPVWTPRARPIQYSATPLAALSGTNSALDLDGVDDHVSVPPGVYFSTEFTLEAWVYERSYNYYSRVLDFGNGAPSENVILALSTSSGNEPEFTVYRGTTGQALKAQDALPLNQWVHLAVTLKNNVATMFINGVASGSGQVTAPLQVNRVNNFIGRSAWGANAYANALFDDVRIWNGARTAAQIRQDMTEPVAPGQSGLILAYQFDEASGPSVLDSGVSGNYDGILVNGASRLPSERTSADVAGLVPGARQHFRSFTAGANGSKPSVSASFATLTPAAGTALEFDGVSQCAKGSYPYPPILNLPDGNAPYTIEAWIKPHAMNVGGIVGWGNYGSANQVTALRLDASGLINYWWGNDLVAATQPLTGAWHHVAASFDGTTRRILLDGVVVASDRPTGHNVPTTRNFAIGRTAPAEFFDGEMDEVRVWVAGRDPASILRDMNRRLQGNESYLVAYYRMDEGSGTLLADATGRGNEVLRLGTNAPAWIPSTAPVGWPIVTGSEVTDILFGDVTLSGTFKGDAASETRTWIEYGRYVPVPNSAENLIYFYSGSPTVPSPVTSLSQVNFDASPSALYGFDTIDFLTPAGRFPPWGGLWYCAARYLGRVFLPTPGSYTFYLASDDGSRLYLDGQALVDLDWEHGPYELGARTNLAAGYHWLEARMFNNTGDAALIASYAGPGIPKQVIPASTFLRQEAVFSGRTPAQTNSVATGFQVFNATATNIGTSGTWVFRVAAANANGTNYGPVQTVLMGQPGAFSALFLNGLGAHVEVPDGDYFLAFPYRDPFTLEAWINPTWIGATETVIGKFNQPSQREYFLALNPAGKVVFHRQGSDYVSSASVPAGQFTHVAATYDGSQRRIYINGELDPAVDPGSGIITNWTAPFLIGARYWSNSLADFFPGMIDDVRVWAVARSQLQIATDRNRRLSGYELGLAAYYRFDEAQGSYATDSTVYDNTTLLVNGAVFVPSGVSFACSTATPVLTIEPLTFGPGVVLYWPITCNEYVLEQASVPNAPPEAWHPVYEPVTPIEGDYAVVLLRDRWDNGYFRLRRL